jgi:hypothetical protein
MGRRRKQWRETSSKRKSGKKRAGAYYSFLFSFLPSFLLLISCSNLIRLLPLALIIPLLHSLVPSFLSPFLLLFSSSFFCSFSLIPFSSFLPSLLPLPLHFQPPFIPFQYGPRTCLGIQFAYTEVKMILILLLQRLRLRLVPGHVVKYKSAITISALNGIKMNIEPRV